MALSTRRSGRTRFTILLLVLTAITLLTLDGRGFGPIDSARSAVLSVLSPVGDAARRGVPADRQRLEQRLRPG